MTMQESLNPVYIDETKRILEKKCMTLLCEAYNCVKHADCVNADWEEEDISKELIKSLKYNKNRQKWRIRVESEHRLYNNDRLSAKKSPRIDFCFSTWTETEWEFFAEAKNLIESNVETNKIGKNGYIKLDSNGLISRYINTGIDNYVSTKYPSNGCLVGYILHGNVQNIVSQINTKLKNKGRDNECLTNLLINICGVTDLYISTHNLNISIKHIMFNYSH